MYREHYQRYCAAVLRGEELLIPAPEAIEKQAAEPLSKDEQMTELKKLREESGL